MWFMSLSPQWHIKCHITPSILHQEHKNYCFIKKKVEIITFFQCAANRLHNRVTDRGEWKGTTAGLCSNLVQQQQDAQGFIQLNFELSPRMEVPQPLC